MSNTPSTEIGWIIASGDNWATYEGPIFETTEEDENGHFIPESDEQTDDGELLYIETHPHEIDRVFVRLWDTDHGMDLEGDLEPRGLGAHVRD